MTDILADFERRSDEIDAKREARLRQGLLRAPSAAPEQAARANALSDRTGQPFGIVAENLDQYEQEDALRRIEDIGKRNPVVGDFMADPRRAAIARDDVGNLNKLSQAIRNTWQAGRDFGLSSVYPTWRSHMLNWESIGGGESGFRATPAPTYFEELATGFAAGWERGIGHSALAGGIDLRSDRTKRSEEIVARGLGYQSADDKRAGRRAAFAAEQERRAQAVERVSEETESQFDLIAKANEADSLWEALGLIARAPRAVGLVTSQSVGMGAPGLAVTAATGGMGRPATMAAAGGSSGWVEYGASISETLAESGVDMMDGHAVAQALRNPKLMAEAKERAAKRGLAIGAFDAVTAGLAGKLLINARRGVASAAWRTGAETGIQIAGGSAGEAAAQLVTGEEMQWGDIIVEGLAELPFSAVEARANYRSARERGQVRWINEQLDIVRRSSAGSAALSEATIAAGNAMLAKRSPEDARAFAEAAGGDGNVYLDAEAARTLFQSDWQVLVDAVGGDTALTQQLAAGDVVIPAAEYFARVAQLPNAEEISRHARLQADALSQVELDAYDFDALAAEMAGDADAAARAEPGGEPSARQRVQDDVYGQLLSTDRYSTAAAEQQAKLFAAGITRLAEMWGTDPWTLYERRMAGIRSAPGPGQADPRSTPPWAGTGRLDALLDALRSPESSDERRIFGPTITDFIVGRGGVTDVGGDLRSMDAHRQRIGLINQRGEDLDRAREAAAEAGYLPADSTVADLLDLIDADLRGNPVYSPAQADRAAQDFQRDLDDLQAAIADNPQLRDMPSEQFNALTNQQIAEILFGRSFEQQRQALNFDQDAATDFDPSAYRAEVMSWAQETFGDTIAPNGRPVWQNFVAWFGESKVVDENGDPMVVYHGTRGSFNAFEMNRPARRAVMFDEREVESQGAFFSEDEADARAYGRNVMPVYLSVQNPFTDPADVEVSSRDPASAQRAQRAWEDAEYILQPLIYEDAQGRRLIDYNNGISATEVDPDGEWVGKLFTDGKIDWDVLDNPDVVARLKERGYDGALVNEPNDDSGTSWFVVRPEQIKSATGNRGNFAPDRASILEQRAALDFGQPAGLAFDETAYRPEVVAWARAQLGDTIAPNGNPAWQNFTAWFGDSKAVDAEGQPLALWHGTREQFDSFDIGRVGEATGNDGFFGTGFYFTDSRDIAGAYGGEWSRDAERAAGANVMQVYLAARNPLELTEAEPSYKRSLNKSRRALQKLQGWTDEELSMLADPDMDFISDFTSAIGGQRFREVVEQNGFDSVHVTGAFGSMNADEWVVFQPNQAKSAADNRGNFSPADPSILGQGSVAEATGTPEFRRWFGESKVVDENGEPLVVYHGGTVEDVFDTERGASGDTQLGRGAYFGPIGVAQEWVDFRGEGQVGEYYLSLQAPFDETSSWTPPQEMLDALESRLVEMGVPPEDAREVHRPSWGTLTHLASVLAGVEGGITTWQAADRINSALREVGFDGIIADWRSGSRQYVAFNPEQIKSATNNAGTFSPTSPNVFEQSAYHGTPHDVDRFSLQRIGTGEGNQAFGWGLYFASQQEVADFYRRNTAGIARNIPATMADSALREAGGDRARAVRALTRRRDALPEAARGNTQAAIDWLRRGQNHGRLYQVDIPEDSDLLDWDAPLSEQPDKVRQALEEGENPLITDALKMANGRDVSGRALYDMLTIAAGNMMVDTRGNVDAAKAKAASEALLAAGIPGLRYLDGDSRDSGGGSHNYVIWDEAAISEPVRLFQSQLGDSLVAVHNLSAENLLFSDRLGGLPAPSIGITKAASPFRGFGSISLIGGRSLATPDAANPVFSADAYTQRFPEMIWPRVKSAKAEKFLDGMDDIDQVWDYLVNNPDRDRAIEVAVQSSGFMRRWLESQGEKPVENVTRENRPPSPWMDDQQLLDVIYQLQDRGVYIYDLPPDSAEAIEIAEAARGAIDRFIERSHEDDDIRARLRETYTGESTFDPEGGLAYSVQSRLAAHAASLKRPPEVDRYATQQALDEQIGERRPEFERWVAEQVTEQFDEPKIQLGRRKVPVTLENVVEAMTRQRRVAGSESTMTFSSGQVAARNAKRYRTIEEIQADRDRIVSPDAEREAGEALEKQLDDYRTAAIQYFTGKNYRGEIDTWEALDSSMKSLADAAKKPATAANVAAALRRNGFEGFPEAVAEAGAEALLGIRQAVTDYFEAKPQRAVALSEFAGAVIPADASQEVRDTLDKHGIRWMEYGEELGLTQEQAVSQLSAELDGGTGDILFQPDGAEPAQPQAPRGQIEIFPDRRMAISLFEGADRSTFLHETGHFFLEVLRDIAADPNAPDQARQEMAILLDWFGIESADQIGREHHEQFARGFEKYLAEGRAPSPELQSAFSAFKAWLLSIYRNLLNLNVTLTDEVRGVMDRMLASDVEIETAQIRQGMEPLFTGAPEGEAGQIGLTEKQLADYADMLAAANEEARAEVMQKLMASHDREAKRWYREETARVRAEVEAEYAAQPVYRAARVLAGARTMHDGTPIPDDIAGMKLDKAALVALYGEPYLQRIRGMYRISGGVHPDDAASVLGFPSGDDLVTALANRGDMQARVEAETTARMRERHGDPMTDGTLPELAMDAVHNNARVKVLQRELDMLSDLSDQPRMTLRAMGELARRTMDGKTPRNIRPHDHLVAERKAARQATAAAARGDYAAALLAKRQQAFNAALYREARKATDEFDRHLRYLRRVEGRRGAIGKAGHDYLEQVDALLEGLELRPVSGRAVERRQRLAEWVARQEADGRPVNVPQNLLDETGLVNIRDMPLGDLRGVVETIKQIEHLAKTKNALFLAGQERDREAVDAEMAASVAAGHENVPERTGDPTRRDIAARAMRDMDIMRLLPANIARELDGYAEGGAVFTNVIQPIRDAIYGKVVPEQTAMQEAVAAIYQKHYTSAEIANLDKPVYRPVVSDTWSKGRILSLAMNWGSDGNREAILTQARSRLTEQQVGELLGTLDARDWQFVQDMVDQVNSYWPAIAEAQRRRTGLVPEKVAAAPFTITTSDGETITVRGGYFPLKYDAERSGYGASQQEIDDFYNAIRTGKTARAATRNGHTIERVGSGGKTVNLGLDIATSHMRDVIRDVHLGDAVAYVHAVLNGQDFKAAVTDAGMAAHLDALNLWLKDVAAGEMAPRSGLEQAIRFIRRNVTASVLGFKATVALLQVTGLIQTASVIGRRNTIRGIGRLFGQSWVGPNSIWKRIRADSAYMDERLGKIPDAVRQVANARDGKFKTGHAALIRWGYAPLARMQAIADAATWLAGEALGAKMFDGDMVKARAYADDLVIRAQAPENFIDKPAIARGTLGENHRQSELVKATTMLLSYMIAKGNVAREKYQDTRFSRPTQAVKFGVDMIQLFALEGMLVAVLTNGLPDDDDDDGYYLDDWVRWITAETFQGAVAGLPLISPLGTASRGYTPQGVIERTWGNIWRSLRILTDDEFNERDAKALVDMAGVATGIPSSQINSTADALWRVRDGEDVAPIEYLVRPENPRD